MAERLGTGLQNLLQQFESAWYLFKRRSGSMSRSFVYLMPSFSPSPIPVSPSESVTKYPPPLLLKAMLVLLKAMLVSLLLCLF